MWGVYIILYIFTILYNFYIVHVVCMYVSIHSCTCTSRFIFGFDTTEVYSCVDSFKSTKSMSATLTASASVASVGPHQLKRLQRLARSYQLLRRR